MDFSTDLNKLLENENRYSDEFFSYLKKYFKSGNRPVLKTEILSLMKKNTEIYNLIKGRDFTETQLKILYVLLSIEKRSEEIKNSDLIKNYFNGKNSYEFSDIFLFFNEKISEIKSFSGVKKIVFNECELIINIAEWIEETIDFIEYKLIGVEGNNYKEQFKIFIALNLLSNIIFMKDIKYTQSDYLIEYVDINKYNKIIQLAYDSYIIENINNCNYDIILNYEEMKNLKKLFPFLKLQSGNFDKEIEQWRNQIKIYIPYINSYYQFISDIFLFKRSDFIYNLILLLKNTKSKQSYINNLNFILDSLFPNLEFNKHLDILYKENFKEILIILNPSEFFMPIFSEKIIKILMRIFNFFYRTITYEFKLRKNKNEEKFKILNEIFAIKNKILNLYEYKEIKTVEDISEFNNMLLNINIDIIRNANKTIDRLNK